jgi:hypothetical protein
MKKIFLISAILLFTTKIGFSQSTLKIFTDLPDETSKVLVYLNGEKQDAFPLSETEFENLSPGKYELRVVFNSDTIADYVKTIKIPANQNIVYKVVKKDDFGKEFGKMGRAFGNETGTTAENDKKGLKEYYRLKKIENK